MFIESDNVYFLPLRSGWDSSLEWNFATEIQTLFNGDEERISLRPLPWEKISYRYTFPEKNSPSIKPFLTHNLREDYLVPYYFLGVKVIHSADAWVVDGQTIAYVQIETIKTGFGDGLNSYQDDVFYYNSWMVLYKGHKVVIKKVFPIDGMVNQDGIVGIGYVSDGVDYTGWKVCPARLGKITNNPVIDTNNKYSIVDVEYDVLDPVEFYEEKGQEKYLSIDVYKKCLLLDGDTLGFTHTQDIDISSNSLGIRKYFSDWDSSYRSFDLRKVLFNRSEFISFLRWIMRRVGRYEPFWCPVYTTDFLFNGATINSISVDNGDKSITTFAVYREDGSFYFAKASNVVVSGNTINYVFSSNFEEVPKKIFYAMLMRLSDDNISFDFSLGGMRVTSTAAVRSVR